MSAEWNGMADCRGACTYSFACGGTGKAVRQAAEKKIKNCLSFLLIALAWLFEFCIIEETKEKGGSPHES